MIPQTSVEPTPAPITRKFTLKEIDERCELLRGHDEKAAAIRAELKDQVLTHGFTPAKAKASTKRIETVANRLTVSTSNETEIHDDVVRKIQTACTPDLFERIFEASMKYAVRKGAVELLAEAKLPDGAPKNLRVLYHEAVETKPKTPSLRIEEL
jgi:hypothetical protein